MSVSNYDVIVIGGSVAGLSATLAIARTLHSVICIDLGKPCNRFAKASHNFITHDNENPLDIRNNARDQIEKYPTANIIQNEVIDITKEDGNFTVYTKDDNKIYIGNNIILATGLNDNIEDSNIENLAQFWGNSIFTCGYCHGFEYFDKKAGLLVSHDFFLKPMIPMIYNWNKNLTVFSSEQAIKNFYSMDELKKKNIGIISNSKIVKINGEGSQLRSVTLKNGDKIELDVLYYAPKSVINMKEIIIRLGIQLDEIGLIKVDKSSQSTNIPGIFAAGDCTTLMRSLAIATQSGQCAGMSVTHKLFNEKWAS